MTLKNWLRKIISAHPPAGPTRRTPTKPRGRLGLEVLDDRIVPATFNVTTPLDVVDPNDGLLSLREAVIAANVRPGADTIVLPAGSYLLSLGGAGEDESAAGDLDVHDDLVIVGAGGPSAFGDHMTRLWSGSDRAIEVFGANLTLEAMSVGSNPFEGVHQGLGIRAVGGSVTLANAGLGSFAWMLGGLQGGGLYAEDCEVTISQSRIEGGVETFGGDLAGGGVYVERGSLTMVNTWASLFAHSSGGDVSGGVVFARDADVRISNCEFDGNRLMSTHGSVSGGAIYAAGGSLRMTKTLVNNCYGFVELPPGGTARGGGLYLAGVAAELANVTISNCFAGAYAAQGGGIYVDGGTLTIQHSTLTGNGASAATAQGGGMYVAGGTVEVRDTAFTGNVAIDFYGLGSGTGGAIHIAGGSVGIDSRTLAAFANNFATTDGDDIFGPFILI